MIYCTFSKPSRSGRALSSEVAHYPVDRKGAGSLYHCDHENQLLMTVARGLYEMAERNGPLCIGWGDTDKCTFCKLKNLKH